MPSPPKFNPNKVESNSNKIFWIILLLILTFLIAVAALISVWVLNSVNPNFSGVGLYNDAASTEQQILKIGCTNDTFGDDTKTFKGKTEFAFACPVLENPCLENICGTDGICHETLITGTCSSDFECNNSTSNAFRCATDTCTCVETGVVATIEYTPVIENVTTALNYPGAQNLTAFYTVLSDYIELEIFIEAFPSGINNDTDMSFSFSLPTGIIADTTAVNIGFCAATPQVADVEASPTDVLFGDGYVLLSNSTTGLATLYNQNTDFTGPTDSSNLYSVTLFFKFKTVV